MSTETAIAVFAILLALAFDFVNGFHDTANAVSTVIYTKALRPRVAIAMSGILNFLGALLIGTAVAVVITKIIPASAVTLPVVVAVLLGAITWNVLTWWRCLPVSSSHCLIGALFGAGIAAQGMEGVNWGELDKVLLALLISPVAGFFLSAVVTWIASRASGEHAGQLEDTHHASRGMRYLQILSSASVSFSHGGNDGQKTMGIISLILATNFAAMGYTAGHVPFWVMVAAATAIALGTMIGGWRVIRTVGEKISTKPITRSHGFAAEATTAAIIMVASHIGAPISTTHTLTSAVAGGTTTASGIRSLNLKTMGSILLAWVLTLPTSAALAAVFYLALKLVWHA